MSLVFVAMSLGASVYLLATGIHRLRLPEPTPRLRRWWARWLRAEGVIRRWDSPPSGPPDELVADLSRMGAVRRVCVGASLGLGTLLGVGIALATAGTVVGHDLGVVAVVTTSIPLGMLAGMTAPVFLHSLWRDPASIDRGASLWQALVRVLPGLLALGIVSIITGARLLGRLATYAYRSDELYRPSIARDHPWTLWVVPACLATVFICLLSVSLRLRSMPLFRSRDSSLALAAGRQWRSGLLMLVAMFNMWLAFWGLSQISLLQLSDFSLVESAIYLLLAVGFGGMALSVSVPDRVYTAYAHG